MDKHRDGTGVTVPEREGCMLWMQEAVGNVFDLSLVCQEHA